MSKIVIGVSGSIACYKSLEIVSALVKKGHEVHVTLSRSAQNFIRPQPFRYLSQNHVLLSDSGKDERWQKYDHVALGKMADVFLIAPATANTLAKLANGFAFDNISAIALVCRCPIIISPAMNTNMWEHPATQRNLEILKSFNYKILEPESGWLACRDEGKGRLPDIEIITKECEKILAKNG